MSQEDIDALVGRALLEYSEARKQINLLMGHFQKAGELLRSVGESLQSPSGLERATALVTKGGAIINSETLLIALGQYREWLERSEAAKKTLQSYGAALD